MSIPKEIERRFLLLDFDRSILTTPPYDRFLDIQQAYFDTPPELDFRLRIIDDSRAVATAKIGSGIERGEDDGPRVSLEFARWMHGYMPYKLRKQRHLIDGFELDVYQDVLSGIFLVEREAPDAATDLVQPAWVTRWIEVTDSLSNRHLAHLAYDLEHALNGPVPDIVQYVLPSRVRKVVVTGGPCSGKSTALEILKKEFGNRIHCVPEVATIIIGQVGVLPPVHNHVENMRFQRFLGVVQRQFEGLSAIQAHLDGKRSLVLDRGLVDNAAYLPGGLEDLRRIFKTTVKHEYEQYDLVIHLRAPPRHVFEAHKANNPARSETYAQAIALDERIHDVWNAHPHYVDVNTTDWNTKLNMVRHNLELALLKWRD